MLWPVNPVVARSGDVSRPNHMGPTGGLPWSGVLSRGSGQWIIAWKPVFATRRRTVTMLGGLGRRRWSGCSEVMRWKTTAQSWLAPSCRFCCLCSSQLDLHLIGEGNIAIEAAKFTDGGLPAPNGLARSFCSWRLKASLFLAYGQASSGKRCTEQPITPQCLVFRIALTCETPKAPVQSNAFQTVPGLDSVWTSWSPQLMFRSRVRSRCIAWAVRVSPASVAGPG